MGGCSLDSSSFGVNWLEHGWGLEEGGRHGWMWWSSEEC